MSELLQKHNFKFQKKFGQNFLTDPKIPARIAQNCIEYELFEKDGQSYCENADENGVISPKRPCAVLEIGPGAGILTKELAKRFTKVCAVEIDNNLIPILDEALCDYDNASVINADIMECDLQKLYEDLSQGSLPVGVCANLPYYITTPIIMKLIESRLGFCYITVMVQKEVARRLTAPAKSADYGAITAVIGLYGSAKKLFDVSAGSFHPRPNVDSAVVRIKLDNPLQLNDADIKKAAALIKAGFGMRRKTLSNALCSLYPQYDKATLAKKISEILNASETVRGEELTTFQYVTLARQL